MSKPPDLTATRGNIHVFTLGGTISMSAGATGVTPTLSGKDLVSNIPGLANTADLTMHEFCKVPGASLRIDDICELASHIAAAFSERADGVVVVLGDEIHAAQLVAKTHSTKPSAFASPGAGPLGWIVESAVVQQLVPTWDRLLLGMSAEANLPSVPLITICLDDDGAALVVGAKADGLVIEAMGGGHVPAWLVDPICALTDRIPVVMTSRTRSGTVLSSTYAFAGSEQDLRRGGVITAGFLPALKARLLLLLLLRSGADREQIRTVFAQMGLRARTLGKDA